MNEATPRSFITFTDAKGIHLKTPLGEFICQNEREVYEKGLEVLTEMKFRLKRTPTVQEAVNGPRPLDDRTLDEKMKRSWFKPLVPEKSPLEKLADSLEVQHADPTFDMPVNERLAYDARQMVKRQNEKVKQDEAAKERARNPEIAKLDQVIYDECWRAEHGSQRILDTAEMLRENLLAGGDEEQSNQLRSKLKTMLNQRAYDEQQSAMKQVAYYQHQAANVKGWEDDPQEARPQVTQEQLAAAVQEHGLASTDQQRRLGEGVNRFGLSLEEAVHFAKTGQMSQE